MIHYHQVLKEHTHMDYVRFTHTSASGFCLVFSVFLTHLFFSLVVILCCFHHFCSLVLLEFLCSCIFSMLFFCVCVAFYVVLHHQSPGTGSGAGTGTGIGTGTVTAQLKQSYIYLDLVTPVLVLFQLILFF